MDTDWISQMDNENFLGIYDVLLDIKRELNISPDDIVIRLMPQIIRFPSLFPADTIGIRDRYCDLRWNAVGFLVKKAVIYEFKLIEGGHRWDNEIAIAADPAKVTEVLRQMDIEYGERTSRRIR
jgi:hypothetical protein